MPRVVDHEERRWEIVYALWLVIAEHGIEGVSLRHVAAAADVSMGRIQHYFGTKDALVLAGCTALVQSAHGGYQETAEAAPRERLLHEKRRLRLITDNLPASVTHVDQLERLTFANRYSAKVFGKDPSSMLGSTLREVQGSELYAHLAGHVRNALRGSRTPDRIVFRDELPVTPTGKVIRRELIADLRADHTDASSHA